MSRKKIIISVLTLIAAILAILILTFWQNSNSAVQANKVEIITNSNSIQNIQSNQTSNNNLESDKYLKSQSDSLLPLFNKMPTVPIFIKDEPIVKKGSETQKGVAYTICEANNPTIIIKKVFYEKNNEKQLTNILKHELTHAWLCRKQQMWSGHGVDFQKKFKEVGGFGN